MSQRRSAPDPRDAGSALDAPAVEPGLPAEDVSTPTDQNTDLTTPSPPESVSRLKQEDRGTWDAGPITLGPMDRATPGARPGSWLDSDQSSSQGNAAPELAMAVAEPPRLSIFQDRSPDTRAFLRFFGALCSIPAVERIAVVPEGGVVHHWVQLNNDSDEAQDAIYDALRRFQATEGVLVGSSDLHIVFADEDASAIPSDAEVIFARE